MTDNDRYDKAYELIVNAVTHIIFGDHVSNYELYGHLVDSALRGHNVHEFIESLRTGER